MGPSAIWSIWPSILSIVSLNLSIFLSTFAFCSGSNSFFWTSAFAFCILIAFAFTWLLLTFLDLIKSFIKFTVAPPAAARAPPTSFNSWLLIDSSSSSIPFSNSFNLSKMVSISVERSSCESFISISVVFAGFWFE